MSMMRRIYNFFGSIYFAIILISLAAVVVIAGTLIESFTDSHLQAAKWTYHHPLFAILLWMFFINILFSALQRWPFKLRHIPFLITHLGLLMIIGGTILKNRIGLQGNLTLFEGSATQSVHLADTHALHIEKKGASINLPISVDSFHKAYKSSNLPELSVKILGAYPHVQEKMHTWIKNDQAHIVGQKNTLPVHHHRNSGNLPEFTEMYFEGYPDPWHVLAVRTDRISDLIKEAFLFNLDLKITSKRNIKEEICRPLKKMIASSFAFNKGRLSVSLFFPDFDHEDDGQPHIQALWQSDQSKARESVRVNLQGTQALINLSESDSWPDEAGFDLDLIRKKPMLVIAEDENEDIHLLFFDPYGRFKSKIFPSSNFESLVVYDGGYGGYAVQAELPFPSFKTSRQDKEKAIEKMIAREIRPAMENASKLAPPLKILQKACDKAGMDFADVFVAYLTTWRQSGQLLYPNMKMSCELQDVLQNIDWEENPFDQQACRWICLLFDRLEVPLSRGENIYEFLKTNRWPFACINDEPTKLSELLTGLSQQVFSVSRQLPSDPIEFSSVNDQARLLSAFFIANEIDYRILKNYPLHSENEYEVFNEYQNPVPTVIETYITCSFIRTEPPSKIEDRQPCVIVEFSLGKHKERVALAYNPKGLKWPVLNGRYMVRYQAESVEIPYRIRLRQAREIHYPQTRQPYSYESDILISDAAGNPVTKTLSMNDVHETWDGYRFYLSGIGSLANQGIKYIQVVVNHDPAKYWLTYPGGLLVFMGIILLFWFKPGNRNF